ncbi:MAG: folylpolyglutamate synthase/dihydrofolate synthase family protein [Candidatus Omnitrophota bacterium]
MTYPEALTYFDSLMNYERADDYDYKKSFRLDRMKALAALLGDPQKETKAIHIAGTKGKGSTAAFIHSILKAHGFKAGLYTSPHLVSFRERIRVNDELISEGDVAGILGVIKAAVDKMGDDIPSFFEVYTMLAYIYFKEKKADIAVYETGLGGRLDATNIIEPLVLAITPISYEHTQKLGSTLREIAFEKAGIIKDGSLCVSGPQEPEALKVIDEVCREKRAKLFLAGRDLTFRERETDHEKQRFDVSGLFNEYPGLESSLLGPHQVVNAAVAIGVIEALKLRGISVAGEAVIDGVRTARWEGRFEIAGRSPFIVLDGAQNRASAHALARAVKKIFTYGELILVLGVCKDKDIRGILEELLPLSGLVILTKSKVTERALDPSVMKGIMDSERNMRAPGRRDILLTGNVRDALREARLRAKKESLILVTGSLFVVGEARELLIAQPSAPAEGKHYAPR